MARVLQLDNISIMTPRLYHQLESQLSQWMKPKDQRHLRGVAEVVAAMLQSGSGCVISNPGLVDRKTETANCCY